MRLEDLQKELARIDSEIQKFTRARDRLQAKLDPLEADRARLIKNVPNPEPQPAVVRPLPSAPVISAEKAAQTVRSAPVVTALVQAKSVLENIDRNLGQTVQTADEVLRLIDGIVGYGSQFRRIAESVSTLSKSGDLQKLAKALLGQGGKTNDK